MFGSEKACFFGLPSIMLNRNSDVLVWPTRTNHGNSCRSNLVVSARQWFSLDFAKEKQLHLNLCDRVCGFVRICVCTCFLFFSSLSLPSEMKQPINSEPRAIRYMHIFTHTTVGMMLIRNNILSIDEDGLIWPLKRDWHVIFHGLQHIMTLT